MVRVDPKYTLYQFENDVKAVLTKCVQASKKEHALTVQVRIRPNRIKISWLVHIFIFICIRCFPFQKNESELEKQAVSNEQHNDVNEYATADETNEDLKNLSS